MKLKRLQDYIKSVQNKIQVHIGEFTIKKTLGQGGNGIVFEAEAYNHQVAIKFLVADQTGKTYQQKLKRFLSEYFNIATLDTIESAVKYIDFDIFKFSDAEGELELPVIIMKKYDGSLAKRDANAVSERGFITLFEFLCSSIKSCHNSGIVHRDIKPENILVDDKSYVLADFGIAGFNPDIFNLRADTKSSERIGNRLFSAPEQEQSGVAAHPTMDIFAMGQVLQWYVKDRTHRGTGRSRITNEFPDLAVYDRIIETCLAEKPADRFQNIDEIEEYIKKSYQKDGFDYLELFHGICVRNFPKNEDYIVYNDSTKRIDKLLADFAEQLKEFDRELWWWNGASGLHFSLTHVKPGVWRFNNREFEIKELWIHYDETHLNDFILFKHMAASPVQVEGREVSYYVLVDDKHHISYSEFQNGYAEIDGEVVNLSDHKVVLVDLMKDEGYVFITTKFHCVFQRQNEQNVRNLIEQFKSHPSVDKHERLKEFADDIRMNKHPYILERL